jgi:hypothetical protein
MGNRKKFTSVLESLKQAEQLLNIGIERGSLSSIERDILLEKLRASYEQLLFDQDTAQPVHVEKLPEVEQRKEYPAKEIIIPKPEPVVSSNIAPKQDLTSIEDKTEKISVEKIEDRHEVVVEKVEIHTNENESLELEITSLNSISETTYTQVETRINEEEKTSTSTLADKYQGKKKFRNEMLGNGKKDVASLLQNKPIGDLTKAIGINDKFLFTKELFNGNAELYARSIRQLNEYTDINDALIYIQENFSWDEKNEAANQLIDLVRRKLLIG